MIQPNNTRFVYYGFMSLFFFGTIVTFIGFFSEFNKWKAIKNDSYITYAKIIKEEKNRFGGSNTFKYQLEYSYNNQLYSIFENGMYEAGVIQMYIDKNKLKNNYESN